MKVICVLDCHVRMPVQISSTVMVCHGHAYVAAFFVDVVTLRRAGPAQWCIGIDQIHSCKVMIVMVAVVHWALVKFADVSATEVCRSCLARSDQFPV